MIIARLNQTRHNAIRALRLVLLFAVFAGLWAENNNPKSPYVTGELYPKVLIPSSGDPIVVNRPPATTPIRGSGAWSLVLRDANNNPVTVTVTFICKLYRPDGSVGGSARYADQKLMSLANQQWIQPTAQEMFVNAGVSVSGPYVVKTEGSVTAVGATNRVPPATAERPVTITANW